MTTTTLSLNKCSLSQRLEQLEFSFKTSLSQLNTQFITQFTEQENLNRQMTQDIAELKRQVALLKRLMVIHLQKHRRDMGMRQGTSQSPNTENPLTQSPFADLNRLRQAGLVDKARKAWLYRSYMQENLRKQRRTMVKWS